MDRRSIEMHPNKCKAGNIVFHKGKKVMVTEVLKKGTIDVSYRNGSGTSIKVNGKKAIIAVCKIIKNGQILTRSPFYVGDNWEHEL